MRQACSRAKKEAGGTSALAKAIGGGITPQAISQWDIVPLTRVPEVEKITGISRHELRPDYFGEQAA